MFEAWILDAAQVHAEEERLRTRVRELDDQRRASFYREFNRVLKDPDTYAVLNWFFLTGLHHFYLGKHLQGTINLLAMILGIFLLFIVPVAGLLIIVLVLAAELPALFRSQTIVTHHNTTQGLQILERLK